MNFRPMGCFLIGITGAGLSTSGEAVLGSVSDDPYDVRTFLRVARPTGTLAHIGTELVSTTEHTLTQRGYFVRPGDTTRGINEAGLAFTEAMVFEDETARKTRSTKSYADVLEKMVSTCESVNDAIELFRSAGATDPAFSLLLADAEGDLAHLEVGNFGINVNHHYSRDNPGMVFAVNCYLSSRLTNCNEPRSSLENTTNNNSARRERGQALARKLRGTLDAYSLARILSDHANRERDPLTNPILEAWGYSICNHGTRRSNTYPHENLPWGTVSAEILQPSAKSFWYAYGWPCGQKPEYGDQIFQQKSWGEFVPFVLRADSGDGPQIVALTTTEGEITSVGAQYRVDQEPASASLRGGSK